MNSESRYKLFYSDAGNLKTAVVRAAALRYDCADKMNDNSWKNTNLFNLPYRTLRPRDLNLLTTGRKVGQPVIDILEASFVSIPLLDSWLQSGRERYLELLHENSDMGRCPEEELEAQLFIDWETIHKRSLQQVINDLEQKDKVQYLKRVDGLGTSDDKETKRQVKHKSELDKTADLGKLNIKINYPDEPDN